MQRISTTIIKTIGLAITLETGVNITTANKLAIKVMTPDGKTKEWPASQAAGSTTALVYNTQQGDLLKPGVYKLHAYVEMSGWKGDGELAQLEVLNEFA